jgi:ABC-2 type transport system permease protein
VAVATAAATVCVLFAGLLSGLALFGWHPFHVISAPNLTYADATARVLAASGYTLLCMLSIATIALALGLLLPRGAEALGVTVAFVVVATILNGQPALHTLAVVLPVHYWQSWTPLFGPAGTAHLGAGMVSQLATIALAAGAAVLLLLRRDPAA